MQNCRQHKTHHLKADALFNMCSTVSAAQYCIRLYTSPRRGSRILATRNIALDRPDFKRPRAHDLPKRLQITSSQLRNSRMCSFGSHPERGIFRLNPPEPEGTVLMATLRERLSFHRGIFLKVAKRTVPSGSRGRDKRGYFRRTFAHPLRGQFHQVNMLESRKRASLFSSY